MTDGPRLRELGWIEGRNVAFDWLYAAFRPERLSSLAAELVRRKVDVIVMTGTTAIRAAKDVTATIPIVMKELLPTLDAVTLIRAAANPANQFVAKLDPMFFEHRARIADLAIRPAPADDGRTQLRRGRLPRKL